MKNVKKNAMGIRKSIQVLVGGWGVFLVLGSGFLAQAQVARNDATINFDWGTGSPNTVVNADQFSARWTGQVQPRYYGAYTFFITADDGCRVWVNSQLVVDKWRDDGGTEVSGVVTLDAGQKYDITLEYFENGGGAKAKLEWSSPLQGREVVPASQLYSSSSARSNVSETLSVSDENGSSIYPNPGKSGEMHEVTLVLDRPSSHVSLSMMNDQGQLILKGQYEVVDSKVSVPIPSIAPGLYIFHVQDPAHRWAKKYLVK